MRKIHLIGSSLLAVSMAHPAYAQVAPQAAETAVPEADEIIVTATKREQTLQDVPISVSVTGADTVEKAQIRDLIDLQSVVPSLKVSQLNAVGQTNFIIRGFGNGNGNDGIESSVGVFIDGVYRARTSAALDDLPEIERIEVLRGPQSTLFGKNVSAGAISIITKKPQFDWGGKAEISLGNYGLINPKGTITGPISESLAFRLSGSINSRTGYFYNTTTKGTSNDRNRWSLRADILFEPSSDFSLRVIGDYNLIKERCCGVTGIQNGPATLAIGAVLGKPISNTSQIFSRNIVFDTNPENRLVGKGLSGQIDWNLGFAKLTSITAYRNQVNQSNQDVDFTGAEVVTNKTANEISTFTQEFRLASEGDGPFSWLVGGFYQDEKVDTAREIRYGKDTRAFADALTGGSAGLIFLLESLQRATNPTIIPGGTYFQPGQGISDAYKLKQQSYSLFGQADFKVTERLTVTGGLAYLHDRKAAASNVVLNDPFSALDLNNVTGLGFLPFAALPASIQGCLVGLKGYVPGATIPTNLFGGSLGARLPRATNIGSCASPALVNPFNLNGVQFFYPDPDANGNNIAGPVQFGNPGNAENGIFTGSKLTYAGRVAYDFDIINAYVSYSTGWKATAVNLSSDSRPANNGVGRSAAPEEVTVYEAGVKAKFRGGFFNLAVFKQEIKGFQSNGFTGLGYALVNAGKQSVKGFEIDAAYRPAPWLSLTGAVTYLDGKYDSFKSSPCFSYDTVRCPRNAQGVLTPSRDLTGSRPAGVPEWSGSVSATLNHSFNDTLTAYLRGEFDYTSNTYLSETTPAALATYGQSNVNMSIGFADSEAKLEVMGWVRNLTNDNSLLATFPTVGQGFPEPASYSGYPNQPRTYGVTIRKSF